MWAASYLKDKAFIRFEPYITHYLKKETVALCDKIIVNVINTVGHYLNLLAQSFGDLDEIKIIELRLLKLIQAVSVPEYLTKFI
jgi:hypothetical protein